MPQPHAYGVDWERSKIPDNPVTWKTWYFVFVVGVKQKADLLYQPYMYGRYMFGPPCTVSFCIVDTCICCFVKQDGWSFIQPWFVWSIHVWCYMYSFWCSMYGIILYCRYMHLLFRETRWLIFYTPWFVFSIHVWSYMYSFWCSMYSFWCYMYSFWYINPFARSGILFLADPTYQAASEKDGEHRPSSLRKETAKIYQAA